jgi:uncharacterized protein (TIGR03546 family)
MTLILKQLFTLLKLLNSDTGHNQIASGVALGFILGMTPALSLQTILILMIILLFRVQTGACFITAFFFSFIAYFLDPLFHLIGEIVLTADSLKPIWTYLYHLPIIPFTRFYNTIVTGSGVVSFVLAPIVFLITRLIVVKYRQIIVERFKHTKFFKLMKASALYKWYAKYEQIYG